MPDTNSPGTWTSISHGSFKRPIPSCNNTSRTETFISQSNPYLKCQPHPDIINDQDRQALETETQSIMPIFLLNIYNEQIQASHQQPNTRNQFTIDQTVINLPIPLRGMLAKDFNAHHHLWDSRVQSPKRHEAPIEIIAKHHISIIKEPHTYPYNYPTPREQSVLNLAFVTHSAVDFVTNWAVPEDLSTGSDHEVVQFELTSSSLKLVPPPSNEQYNLAKAEWQASYSALYVST